MNLNKLLFLFLFILSACGASYTWVNPNISQSQASNIKKACWAQANVQSPVYLCRNVLACTPNESGLVFSSIARRDRLYDACMFQNGFVLDPN